MDAVLFGVLAGGVQEYLHGIPGTRGDSACGGAGPGSGSGSGPGSGSGEAGRLAAAWRALLRQHGLGPDGRCQTCGGGRWAPRLPWVSVAPPGHTAGARLAWLARFGWWPVRRRHTGLCTVWQVAIAYFIRRLPNGER